MVPPRHCDAAHSEQQGGRLRLNTAPWAIMRGRAGHHHKLWPRSDSTAEEPQKHARRRWCPHPLGPRHVRRQPVSQEAGRRACKAGPAQHPPCGWALVAVGGPCVAHRVWATPACAGKTAARSTCWHAAACGEMGGCCPWCLHNLLRLHGCQTLTGNAGCSACLSRCPAQHPPSAVRLSTATSPMQHHARIL